MLLQSINVFLIFFLGLKIIGNIDKGSVQTPCTVAFGSTATTSYELGLIR